MTKISFDTVRRRLPDAIEAAVEATLLYIGTNQDGRVKLPWRDRVHLALNEETANFRPKLEFREEPSLKKFFEYHWGPVSKLSEVIYLSLLLAMIQYVDLPPNSLGYQFREKSAKEDAQKNGWEVTRPVLEACLQRRFHGETKEEYLPWIVERIESGAKLFYFGERHTGPVIKLQIDGPDKIDLDENVRLRRLTSKERSRLCDPDDLVPSILSDFEASETFWVFEMDVYHITEEEPEYYPADPRDVFEWYLTAIRMVKPGSFYIPHETIQDLPGESAEFGHSDPMFSRSNVRGDIVEISEKDLPEVQNWLTRITPILAQAWKDRIEIALERFNESFLRLKLADIIIDSAIALEALLLGDLKKSSTYVLAIRGSVLLGSTLQERQAALEQFKRFFKTRNNVVHGGVVRKYLMRPEETLSLLRRTFSAFIPLLTIGNQSVILKALDAYLLSSPTEMPLETFIQNFCNSNSRKS